MAQKRQRQTFEKMKREQAVREKRVRKQERKEAARLAKVEGTQPGEEPAADDESPEASEES